MKRKTVSIISALMISMSVLPTAASADEAIHVQVNGSELVMDAPPYIDNGTTMVQFRPIFEKLGLSIT
ncbi:copper amine oxidase N-terminal domain-containing protein [Paenibacillus alginolyticus]|nr:stalk domain-containing protein [Paenibacillus alginolyticus]MCY9666438.1 copper amine oxidase N-terminal domain-containing protein [Paenibacillus alginolyticus]